MRKIHEIAVSQSRAKKKHPANTEIVIPQQRQQLTPIWNGAPSQFVTTHEFFLEGKMLAVEHKVMLERLSRSDIRVKNVWKTLERQEGRRKVSLAEASIYPQVAVDWGRVFYLQIIAALKNWSTQPKLSTTERKRAYADIVSQSRQLAADLRRLSDNELTDTPAHLDSSTLRNLGISLRLDILENPPVDVDPEQEFRMRLRHLPNIPEFLDLVATKANVKAGPTRKQSRPTSVGAQYRPFIHHMSDHFLSRYGSRLHQTVASITAVIFKTEISVDLVTKQLKRGAR
jgi:hypothetical protein